MKVLQTLQEKNKGVLLHNAEQPEAECFLSSNDDVILGGQREG